MSKHVTARRRLRVEVLEGRDVPAVLAGDEQPLPPTDDPTKPDVVITTVDGDPKDAPVDPPIDAEPADPDVILTTGIEDDDTEPEPEPEQPPVDLAAAVTVDKVKPSVGDIITVSVKVANHGMDAATGVEVQTELPAGLTFLAAAGPGTFDSETGTWTPGGVLPEVGAVLLIKARVTDPAAATVTAAVTAADQPDPQAGNNEASKTVTPVLAGLRLTKTSSSPTPLVGSIAVLTLAVKNSGPGTARDIVVSDTLGDGLQFVRVVRPGRGTFSSDTKTWTIPALPSGVTAHLLVVVRVTKAGEVASPATMTATGIDPARSVLEAPGVVTAVKTNSMPAWSFHAGPNKPGPGPVPVGARPPALPTFPVIIPPGSPLAAVWARFGLPRG